MKRVCLLLLATLILAVGTSSAQRRDKNPEKKNYIELGEFFRNATVRLVLGEVTLKLGNKTEKVVILGSPERGTRAYRLERRIDELRVGFWRPLDKSRVYTRIGELGQKLAVGLLEIPGVASIEFKANEVDIRIGLAFNWYTLESQVLEVLRVTLLGGDPIIHYKQPKELRLMIERFPNEQIREFHTNQLMSDYRIYSHKSLLGEESRVREFALIGELGKKLVIQLVALKSVEEIYLKPYSVTVELKKGDAWIPEREQEIRRILASILKENPAALTQR